MIFRRNGQPHAIYTRDPNAPYMNDAGKAACRLPSGHPEAFFEAFANIYRAAYDDMALRATGQEVRGDRHHLPEHQRRRRGDVLHPAMRRQQRRRRPVDAAGASARAAIERMPCSARSPLCGLAIATLIAAAAIAQRDVVQAA